MLAHIILFFSFPYSLAFGGESPLEINSRFICRIYYRCRYNKYEYLSVKNFGNSFSYLRLHRAVVCDVRAHLCRCGRVDFGYRITICFAYSGQRKMLSECEIKSERLRDYRAHTTLSCFSSFDVSPAYYHQQTKHNFFSFVCVFRHMIFVSFILPERFTGSHMPEHGVDFRPLINYKDSV